MVPGASQGVDGGVSIVNRLESDAHHRMPMYNELNDERGTTAVGNARELIWIVGYWPSEYSIAPRFGPQLQCQGLKIGCVVVEGMKPTTSEFQVYRTTNDASTNRLFDGISTQAKQRKILFFKHNMCVQLNQYDTTQTSSCICLLARDS
jgi:hypothetical protein